MTQNKVKIIGLTGKSGSGKTTCSDILKKSGCFVINCDKISRDVLNVNEDCYFDVINYFGDIIINSDKTINRKKLGEIVFSDEKKLETLTQITHKYIIKKIIDKVDELSNNNHFEYIIIDAPVLIGTPLMQIVDEVWVVYSSEQKSLERILKRDDLDVLTAKNRLDKQISYDVLFEHADLIIENNGDIENLEKIIRDMGFDKIK